MAIGNLKYKGIVFGDDLWGTVVDEQVPYQNELGLIMKRYLIVPSSDLVDAYPEIIKRMEMEGIKTQIGMAIWVEYPMYWVTDENPSKTNAIARIDCGYDGRTTPLTRRNVKLKMQVKDLEIGNEALRLNNIVGAEENYELMEERLKQAQKYAEINDTMKGGQDGKEDTEDIKT